MLNCFREHCMFDQGWESSIKAHFLHQMLPAECGSERESGRERGGRERGREGEREREGGREGGREREREGKLAGKSWLPPASFPAHSQDGHIVSLNKSNAWHCDSSASAGAQMQRVSRTVPPPPPRSPRAAASGGASVTFSSCCRTATVSLVFWLRVEKNKT